jgi:hypothetical protein
MQEHELVHAYTAARGRSLRFLDEGLAEALSCGLAQRTASELNLLDLIAWSSSYGDALALQNNASVFVAHLLKMGGPIAFLRLHGRLKPGASAEEVEAAFQLIYASSAAELYAEARRAQGSDVGCVRPWECSGPTWDTKQLTHLYESPCGLPSFTPFEVGEPSLFVGAAAQLLSCDGLGFSPSLPSSLVASVAAGLEPGRYFLGLFGDPLRNPEPASLPAALYPVAEVVGTETSCATLRELDAPLHGSLAFEPRTFARGLDGPFVLRWSDSGIAARRTFDEAQGLRLVIEAECSEGLQAWICEGCAAPSACQPLCEGSAPSEAATLPAEPVLKMLWSAAQGEGPLRISLRLSDLPM